MTATPFNGWQGRLPVEKVIHAPPVMGGCLHLKTFCILSGATHPGPPVRSNTLSCHSLLDY